MRRVKCVTYLSVLLLCCISFAEAQKRPVIGISDLYKDDNSSAVPRSYVDAVLQVGGLPVVIPLMYDDDKIVELLSSLDGIIFTGGEDFDPSYYNERPIPQMGKVNAYRDEFDIKLLRLAVEQGVPVLGICRGIQLINIVYGGTLYQDLSTQYHDNSIRHRQKQPKEDTSHSVLVEDNTVFSEIVQQRMLMVNSSHHQAIKKVAPGFVVAGKSPDKIVEAREKIDSRNWILGVQFHPEVRVTRDNAMRNIFQRFINEASNSNKSGRERRPAYAAQTQTNRDRYTEQQLQPRYQSRNQFDSQTQSRPQSQSNSQTYQQQQKDDNLTTDIQYIYKIKVDTQYIYKSVDTVYLSVVDSVYEFLPSDTVYLSVVDTIYEFLPTDTVYLSVVDTIYFPLDYVSNPISETNKPTSVIKKQTPEKQLVKKQAPEKQVVEKSVTEKSTPVKQTTEKQKRDNIKSQVDTMIYTPGTPVIPVSDKEAKKAIKTAEKNEIKKAKAAEKEATKNAKAAGEESKKNAKAAEKEAKAKQNAEIKAAKKESEEKEKLYRQEQIELAKLKKKEQKEQEEQAKKEQKEKEEQAKKEQKEKEEQAKKEQKEKKEA